MAKTPAKTAANVKPDTAQPTETVTKLAEAPAGKPTKDDLDEIAGKDRDPKVAEESANADVAETLKENAKKPTKEEEKHGYFHGQGGAFGV